jgi:2-polyprenyl-3-methyl-5-hydroxy-6-metoxy-1,4-benzoquinol methylase
VPPSNHPSHDVSPGARQLGYRATNPHDAVWCVRLGNILAAVCDPGVDQAGGVARLRLLNGLEITHPLEEGRPEAQRGELLRRSDWLRDVDRCPLCATTTDLARSRFEVLQLFWGVPIVECTDCGLVFKRSVGTDALFRFIYSEHYVHFLRSPDPGTLGSRVARLGRPPGRHLDYGCGRGDFVRAAAAAGWESWGADPFLSMGSDTAAGESIRLHRLDAAAGELESMGSFDVISAWAVAEHLARPLEAFRGLATALRPGGVLIFNSPNGSSLTSRLSGGTWRMASLLEHLQFLTPRAVEWLAAQLGLRVRGLRHSGTPFPLGMTRGGAIEQGLRDLPILARAIDTGPGEEAVATEVTPSWIARLHRRLLRDGGGGRLADAARSLIDVLRLGDHLEVTLTK